MPAVTSMFSSHPYWFDYVGTPITWECDDCGKTIVLKPPKAGWNYDPDYAGIDGSGWDFYSKAEVDDIATYLVIDSRKDHYSPYCWNNCEAIDLPYGELS